MYEVLENIGLSRNESKTYLALLELGFTPAGTIAKKARIDRTNIYDSLEKLKTKGLVGFVSKAGTRHYEAAKPKFLKNMIRDKEKQLSNILPQLELSESLKEKRNRTNVYEGIQALRNLICELSEYNEKIIVIGNKDLFLEKTKYFISHFKADFVYKITDSKATIIICSEEVLLISWEKEPVIIQIVNENISVSLLGSFFN
ncbi:TrmB family transcriptional regulator [Bacteroidota bacterium]